MSDYLRPIDLNGTKNKAVASSSMPSKMGTGVVLDNHPPPQDLVTNQNGTTSDNCCCDLLPSSTTTTAAVTSTTSSIAQRMKWSIPGITTNTTTTSNTSSLHVPDRYTVIQKSFSNPPALTRENQDHYYNSRKNNMLKSHTDEEDDDHEESQYYYGKIMDDYLDQKQKRTKKKSNNKQIPEKEYRASSAPKAIMHEHDDPQQLPSLLSNQINKKHSMMKKGLGIPPSSNNNAAGGIDMQSLGITGKVMTPEVRRYYDAQQGRVTGVLATPQVVTNHHAKNNNTTTTTSNQHLTRTIKTRNTAPPTKTNNINNNKDASDTSLIDTIGEESPANTGFYFTNSFTEGILEQTIPPQRQTTTTTTTTTTNDSTSVQPMMSSSLPQKLRGLFLTKPTTTNSSSWKMKNIILDSQYNVKDVIEEDDESVTERTSNTETAFRRVQQPAKNMPYPESKNSTNNVDDKAPIILPNGNLQYQMPTTTNTSSNTQTADLRQILKQCIQDNFSNVETLDESFQNDVVQAFTKAVQEVKRSRQRESQYRKPLSEEIYQNSSLIVSVVVLVLTMVRLWYLCSFDSSPMIIETPPPSNPIVAWITSISEALMAAKQNNFESDLDYRLAVIQFESGV